MTDVEEWRPVAGWSKYEVSNLGRVRSLHFAKPRLRKIVTTGPYPTVMLKQDGDLINVEVHSLVATAFLGPRHLGMEVAHLNGVNYDVRAANLAYKTPKENAADKVLHGTQLRGIQVYNAKLTDADVRFIRDSVAGGGLQKDLARRFRVSKQHISDIVRGKKRVSA